MNRNINHYNQQLSGKTKPLTNNIYQTDYQDTRNKVTKQYSVDPYQYAKNRQQNEITNFQDHKQVQEKQNEVSKRQQSLLDQNMKHRSNENQHYPQSTICQTRNASSNSKICIKEVKYQPLIQSNYQLQIQLKQNEPQSQIKNVTREQPPDNQEKYERPTKTEKSIRPIIKEKPLIYQRLEILEKPREETKQNPELPERYQNHQQNENSQRYEKQGYPQRQLHENSKKQQQLQIAERDQEQQLNYNSMEIDMYESLIKSVVLQCYHCDLSQSRDFIFLPCGHQFHSECLKSLLETQVNQQSTIITCKCNIKIPQNIIKKYLNPFQLQIYYQIQVQLLPIHNQKWKGKWKKCNNQGCDFIYILQSYQSQCSRCPNCLDNVVGQSIIFEKKK